MQVSPDDIQILASPLEFNATLHYSIKQAKKSITICALYFDNPGLIDSLSTALGRNSSLKVTILTDALRQARSSVDLDKLLKYGSRVQINCFKTNTFLSKITPNRFNESFSLLHCKCFLVDDSVLITGANFSDSYLTNRQDRYYYIHNASVTSWFRDLIDVLSVDETFNKRAIALREFAQRNQFNVRETLDTPGTWIIPSLQMKPFAVTQDQELISNLFAWAQSDHTVTLSSPYLNPTPFVKSVIEKYLSIVDLISASPQANGFYNSRGAFSDNPGISRHIPTAYSHLAYQLLKNSRVKSLSYFEYSRPGWTFHAKGIWVQSGQALATFIGSSNLGYRSMQRDFEASVLVVTRDERLKRRIGAELEGIRKDCIRVGLDTLRSPSRRAHWFLRGVVRVLKGML